MAGPKPNAQRLSAQQFVEALTSVNIPSQDEGVIDFSARLDAVAGTPAKDAGVVAIDPVIAEEEGAVGRFLFDRVGHLDLVPYAWIYAETDEREDALSLLFGQPLLNNTRSGGLKSITCTNEYGKFPTVEFEIYDPEFRVRRGSVNGETPNISLYEKFKIGKTFSVRFGYKSAFTSWPNLKVVQNEVTFEEGTVVLKIKGQAASRLLSTHSVDVFTKEFGKTALDAIARVVEMPVSYSQLLKDEYDRILSDAIGATAAAPLSSRIFKVAGKADVDYFYDPEREALRLQTPYKMELIKRGATPRQITYGYPSSPISSLSIETKYPKKKFGGTGQGLSNTQEQRGKDEVNNGTTFKALISGFLYSADGGRFQFGTAETVDDTPQGREYIGKKYPASAGYIIEKDEQTIATSVGGVGAYYVRIYRNFTVNADTLEKQEVVWSRTEANIYAGSQGDGSIFVPTSVEPDPRTPGLLVIVGGLYTPSASADPNKPKAPPASPPATTTKQVKDEGAENPTQQVKTKTQVVDSASIATAAESGAYSLGTENYNKQQAIKALQERARAEPEKYRIDKKESNGFSVYMLTEQVPDDSVPVTEPETPSENNAQQTGTEPVETNSQDDAPKPAFTPQSAAVKPAGARRRSATTTLTLNMKAGDFTMRIGDLVQLTDLYKSMDGFYYIHREEHKVSAEGFQTQVQCRKATPKTVTQYGSARTPAPRAGGRSPVGGDQAAVNGAANSATPTTPRQVQIINVDAQNAQREQAAAEKARVEQEKAAAENAAAQYERAPLRAR